MSRVLLQLDALVVNCHCCPRMSPPIATANGRDHAGTFDPFDFASNATSGLVSQRGSGKPVSCRPPADRVSGTAPELSPQLACATSSLISPAHSSAAQPPLTLHRLPLPPQPRRLCSSTHTSAVATATVAISADNPDTPSSLRQIVPKQASTALFSTAAEAPGGESFPCQAPSSAGMLRPRSRRQIEDALVPLVSNPKTKDFGSCSGGGGDSAAHRTALDIPGQLERAVALGTGRLAVSIELGDSALPFMDGAGPVEVARVGEPSRTARKSMLRGLPRAICTAAGSSTTAGRSRSSSEGTQLDDSEHRACPH
jgi:hypothetical protein